MVKLFVGSKGSGKTKKMVELANGMVEKSHGNIVYISKNHRLMHDLKYKIRIVYMQEYKDVTNIDEYTGFIYGIISSDHDIEVIFIDGILHYEDVHIPDLKGFFTRLKSISKSYEVDFIVSVSADIKDLDKDIIEGCEILS